MHKESNLIFIDRLNYNKVLDKNFKLPELINEITGITASKMLSDLTKNTIISINEKLQRALFDSYYSYGPAQTVADVHGNYPSIKSVEDTYVSDAVKTLLIDTPKEDYYSNPDEKKYYELIPLPNNDILVIFDEGFFTYITESKNKLKDFVLSCLRIQYNFNSCMERLMKLYTSLQMNEATLDMVKLRFQ